MPKDKDERRKERRTDRRTDRRARVKKKLPSNGTVQRLREARREIKQLREKLAGYEGHSAADVEQPADHPPGHPPVDAASPE